MQHFKCKSSQITQYWEPMNCRSLIGKCTSWAIYLCQWNSRWWTELIISSQAGEDDEGESRRAEQRALHVITVFILFHRKTTWQSFAKTREKISHQFIRLCCLHLSLCYREVHKNKQVMNSFWKYEKFEMISFLTGLHDIVRKWYCDYSDRWCDCRITHHYCWWLHSTSRFSLRVKSQ